MVGPLLIGGAIVVATVIFHVIGLAFLSHLLQRLAAGPLGRGPHSLSWFLAVAALVILAIHTAEAWGWAVVYLAVGEFETMEDALYFSAVTSTTLGYGDIVLSKRWRLLGALEASGGLILFAVSAAYLLAVLRRLLDPEGAGTGPAAKR